ncbi:MAG: septal ring lytic transglycosylase RlpA family lipoprotein [Verrucomicrobiae bacterium]|nr:septal ring lytic transglycosylase RlpA family lipoprotein [Verrucomicrobiae bacterium]MCP5524464.1 septal ring lytic transglycosylase RlpA family lipoprotein [Verrucomicrobiales bacterium]
MKRLRRLLWLCPVLLLLPGCGTPSSGGGGSQGLPANLFGASSATGTASWYGDELKGRPMANGQPFDPNRLTCASWFYDFGTRLHVQYERRYVVVVVTDRGPAKNLVRQGRIIDLSRAAFARLAPLGKGVIRVKLTRLR